MHPPILEVRRAPKRLPALAAGLLAAMLASQGWGATPRLRAAPPSPECPAKVHALIERFVGADCLECWQAKAPVAPGDARLPGAQPAADGEWSIDWIVPAAHDGAPLAAPAIPESAERLGRLGEHLAARLEAAPAAFDTVTGLDLPAQGRLLWVHSSLPWNGYFGVQMHARGAWPAGSTGWAGLVEILPPGVDGTVVPRRLVRTLTGPVTLPASPAAKDAVAPLFAMRWPESAQPERIMAIAWIEGRDGRVLQIASDRCVDPK